MEARAKASSRPATASQTKWPPDSRGDRIQKPLVLVAAQEAVPPDRCGAPLVAPLRRCDIAHQCGKAPRLTCHLISRQVRTTALKHAASVSLRKDLIARRVTRRRVTLPAPKVCRCARTLVVCSQSVDFVPERRNREADTPSSPFRSTVTTVYGRPFISTSPSSHATRARAAVAWSSTESSPVIGGSRVCATVDPGGSTGNTTPTFLGQRPKSPSGLGEHANALRPHQHEGQRSTPVRPQARGPVVPVDPRWCRHRFRMGVPSAEVYRLTT